MKYKVGDKVKVRSDLKAHNDYGDDVVTKGMELLAGKIVTIANIVETISRYKVQGNTCNWTDEMFEGKVKEGEKLYKTWEVLRFLAERKELKFRRWDDGLVLSRDYVENCYKWESGHRKLGVHDKWMILHKEVPATEAIDAWSEGKKIQIDYNGCYYLGKGKPGEVLRVSFEILHNGSWYILD